MDIVVDLAENRYVRRFLLWFPLVKVSHVMKWVILLLNIFLPGSGSILAGIMKFDKKKGKKCVLFGIMEALTFWIFGFGWFCSIFHGIMIYVRASGVTYLVKLGVRNVL